MFTPRIMQPNVPEGTIDFGIGQPDIRLLPRQLMAQAAAHRLGQDEASLSLQYGVEAGDGYFHMALAQFLSQGYGMPVAPEQLFTTNGASQALDLICKFYTQPGDTVFVEEPTYFLALLIFQDYPLNIVSIPTDEDGLIIEALEAQLQQHRPTFLYTIPTFHNPSTVTLSAPRREALVRLSEEHNFLIVADEVYQLLYFSEPPPPPLVSYDRQGTVISVGTFSKILAPGLRLGWLHARDPELLSPAIKSGFIESGGGLNPFTASVVRSAIELGLQDQYLQQLRATYHARASAMNKALRHHLPPEVTFSEPQGGFFTWLRFPEDVDTAPLLVETEKQQIRFKPGTSFSSDGGLRNYARLCFAFYDEVELVEGVARLAEVVNAKL